MLPLSITQQTQTLSLGDSASDFPPPSYLSWNGHIVSHILQSFPLRDLIVSTRINKLWREQSVAMQAVHSHVWAIEIELKKRNSTSIKDFLSLLSSSDFHHWMGTQPYRKMTTPLDVIYKEYFSFTTILQKDSFFAILASSPTYEGKDLKPEDIKTVRRWEIFLKSWLFDDFVKHFSTLLKFWFDMTTIDSNIFNCYLQKNLPSFFSSWLAINPSKEELNIIVGLFSSNRITYCGTSSRIRMEFYDLCKILEDFLNAPSTIKYLKGYGFIQPLLFKLPYKTYKN